MSHQKSENPSSKITDAFLSSIIREMRISNVLKILELENEGVSLDKIKKCTRRFCL